MGVWAALSMQLLATVGISISLVSMILMDARAVYQALRKGELVLFGIVCMVIGKDKSKNSKYKKLPDPDRLAIDVRYTHAMIVAVADARPPRPPRPRQERRARKAIGRAGGSAIKHTTSRVCHTGGRGGWTEPARAAPRGIFISPLCRIERASETTRGADT